LGTSLDRGTEVCSRKETEDPSIFVSKRFQYPPNALLFLSTSVISADNKGTLTQLLVSQSFDIRTRCLEVSLCRWTQTTVSKQTVQKQVLRIQESNSYSVRKMEEISLVSHC